MENAIWSVYVEVTDFNAGSFLRETAQAAADGLGKVKDALDEGAKGIQRAETRVGKLADEIRNSAMSHCNDLDTHCGVGCISRLFDWCVIPDAPPPSSVRHRRRSPPRLLTTTTTPLKGLRPR